MGRILTGFLALLVALGICSIPTLLINHYFEPTPEDLAGAAMFSAIAGLTLGILSLRYSVSIYIDHEELRKKNKRIYLPYGIAVTGGWLSDCFISALWGVFGTLIPMPVGLVVAGAFMFAGSLAGDNIIGAIVFLLGLFIFSPTVDAVNWLLKLIFGGNYKRLHDNFKNAGTYIHWLERAMRQAQQDGGGYGRRRKRKGLFGWTLTVLRFFFSPF